MSVLKAARFQDASVANGLTTSTVSLFLLAVFLVFFSSYGPNLPQLNKLNTVVRFVYGCFLKPHTGDGSGNQQDALESFYHAQASIYDATRSKLLKGREDMLGLVAAQLKQGIESGTLAKKPIWVDVGGGTGWNIEYMATFVNVPEFFRAVYLVDLSPSLCDVAKKRFERLGWANVTVLCQDARSFDLADYEASPSGTNAPSHGAIASAGDSTSLGNGVDLITFSYSLSMIPDFYSVVDSMTTLLSPTGIIGIADFYVQNRTDFQSRNYIGGVINRHCMWISRTFWRIWFEFDRVNLDAARRDYCEYRFGTVLSVNARNHFFGFRIPYYIWVGCSKDSGSTADKLAELDATATESPFLAALGLHNQSLRSPRPVSLSSLGDTRSKAYELAIVNLAARLPLPSTCYQTHRWRIFYEDHLPKHRQFKDEYIYAFNWEDARADERILKIKEDDVVLAITSAGDQVMSYALQRPKRIHTVDLNPAQNHLLELKLAAFTALPYEDVWCLFGEGVHPSFRSLLIEKLSPHLSSLAFDYWLHHGPRVFAPNRGLYYTGGSRHALLLAKWLFAALGLTHEVQRLCAAPTLAEQREVWEQSIRRVLLSRILAWTVIGSEQWMWKAAGVPPAQRQMIEADYLQRTTAGAEPTPRARAAGHAIWQYLVDTFDPVVESTLVSSENHYYLLCLQGRYSRACHPPHLSPRAHARLSRSGALSNIRIHTDELAEVVARLRAGTLTVAVLMDTGDWFDPGARAAVAANARALNRAMAPAGRVLMRSAGLHPWYMRAFADAGFACKRVAARHPGACVDRVNMYASTWLCTKTAELGGEGGEGGEERSPVGAMERLEI